MAKTTDNKKTVKKVVKTPPKTVNKKAAKPKSVKKKQTNNGTVIRAFLTLFIVVCATATLLFGLYWSAKKMLWENPHFTIKEVNVVSESGWWDGRNATMCQYLDIKINKSNIFDLKLNELRDKLLRKANILDATIIRTLPNKLDINIIERIPRARIKTKENNFVIDKDCIVIRKGIVARNLINYLPRILIPYNLKEKISNGEYCPEFKYALKLIMLTKTDYPLYKINDISIIDQSKISFVCEFNGKRYQIHMPLKNIASDLEALSVKIDSLKRHNINFRTIDLTNRDAIAR